MRKALNENPLVQAALIGVLAIAVALLLMLRLSSGGSEEPAPAEATTEASVANADPAAPASGADASSGGSAASAASSGAATGDPAVAGASSANAPTGAQSDFRAGPGLPREVVDAYEDGKAVALLIVNPRATDDRDLEQVVRTVEGHKDVAVFVTNVKHVSDYSRVTQGVDLDRTPALVVIRPKSLTSGSTPTAVVSYGFRGTRSVLQAIDNALYKGPQDLPYYP